MSNEFYQRFAKTISNQVLPTLEGRNKEDIKGTNDDDDDDMENIEDALIKTFNLNEPISKKVIQAILSDKELKKQLKEECTKIINGDT